MYGLIVYGIYLYCILSVSKLLGYYVSIDKTFLSCKVYKVFEPLKKQSHGKDIKKSKV